MTHGKPEPAKMITLYCEECKNQRECYDMGNRDGKRWYVCENCLMTICVEKKKEKKAEMQGSLF